MEQIKVVQFGCGKMAKYIMRYVYEKGGIIVGAIDKNENIIGKDISYVMESNESKNVRISSLEDAKNVLTKTKPDICIITTMSLLNDVKDAMLLCASLGINAITTCEEAFYPQNSNPNLFNKIDSLAKENACTISGSGYQDIFWGNLITCVASATHKIIKIKGSSSYNVEDYGIALAKAHGAGLSMDEFNKEIQNDNDLSQKDRDTLINNGNFMPSYMWNVNGWLCEKLGLSVISQAQKCIPCFADEDIYSSTLDMKIKKGEITGMSAVVTTNTKEGIIIESECIGKVYSKNEYDKNQWEILGEPNTSILINNPSTVELTCATIVNRIPDVINSPNGYVTTNNFTELRYRLKPLYKYLVK